jgi:hypothetical protein
MLAGGARSRAISDRRRRYIVAEIVVVFGVVLEHTVDRGRWCGEFGEQPVVLVGVGPLFY